MSETITIKEGMDHEAVIAAHKKSPFAEYFKEVIYGGVDGIVTTFAVVSGFSGAAFSSTATAQVSFTIVLLFGLANLFADAISMGLGNFLSVRSEKDQYRILRSKEKKLLRDDPEAEHEETVAIMKAKGFSESDAITLATIYSKNEDYWLDFMMANEYLLDDPRDENEALTGFTTFASFMIFGCVPILPFVLFSDIDSTEAFQISTLGTLTALLILGLMKWRIVGTSLARSVGEIMLVGGIASIIAFAVGTFFHI